MITAASREPSPGSLSLCMETPDILIIGGGIVGVSLARELVRVGGARVVVVEQGKVGGASSSAAAGLLSPTFDPLTARALAGICRQAAALYPAWVQELRAAGAADFGYRRVGLLSVARDAAEAERLQAELAAGAESGRRAEWLDARELRRREPGLNASVAGAVCFADDAHVDPAQLVAQVARVAALAGVVIHEQEPVRRIERQGDRISAVHTARAVYQPGLVVLTAGAWAGELAAMLGLQLPTRPVKGQMVMAECRVPPVTMPLHAGNALLIPWPDGRLALGVTVEEAGFDDRVRLASLQAILRDTMALVPAVAELALGYAWAGLRPATPDGLPYMGPVPAYRNLWVSTGHFRKGTLLAPLAAQLVADSIRAGQPVAELTAFLPARVSNAP